MPIEVFTRRGSELVPRLGGSGRFPFDGVTPPVEPPPAGGPYSAAYWNNPDENPISFPTVAAARAGLELAPSDANYVMWNDATMTNLEQAFRLLGTNDILVLPERAEPYPIVSDWGFPAAGVGSIRGKFGNYIPVSSTWNGMTARTWFAMARAQYGILGLGPGAVVQPLAPQPLASGDPFRTRRAQSQYAPVITDPTGPWSSPEQIQDSSHDPSDPDDGWLSTGRFWRNTSDVVQSELAGCQEKLIEAQRNNPYFGNFTMRGRDFGGIAYHGIDMIGGGRAERIRSEGGWRGWKAVPNSESGAIAQRGNGYDLRRCTLIPLDPTGARVGSSPFMINSSNLGHVEHITCDQSLVGMPTLWNVSGYHEIIDVKHRYGLGPGFNLERINSGAHIKFVGGSYRPNRANQGGNGPAPDGLFGNKLHMQLNVLGPCTIELVDVDYDKSAGPLGTLCFQGFGSATYSTRDAGTLVVINTLNGVTRPHTIY